MMMATKIVFLVCAACFGIGGGMALMNKDDPDQRIKPPAAIGMLVAAVVIAICAFVLVPKLY